MLLSPWLIPLFPLLGFAWLALAGAWVDRRGAAAVGVGSVALSFVVAVLATLQVPAADLVHPLGTWFSAGGFTATLALRLDPLSAVFTLVITGVGALILLYATEYMRGESGFARFFAYMDLFVAAMLVLVLADDLLLLFLGWEGVGLCSYLLIGFWYRDPANGRAARKAFVVTRVGDVAMMIALFLLASGLGSLRLPDVLGAAEAAPAGGAMATLIAVLLLAGAVGKSAQLPLQVWLPDAMAGPTPVSALIHAATMVTAGVYLIARTHPIFETAPAVLAAVGTLGALTLLLAGLAALAQRDIKRVLAYSTISQIGYMFVALGVGAWSAAIFHFVTHAFFKALLFLGAGSVILAADHERDLAKLGGFRRTLPVPFWTFTIASLSLAGLPLVTAGFYSKDAILAGTAGHSPVLWVTGLIGATITGLYIFRAVFLAFGGPEREPVHRPGLAARVPLIALAVLSVIGGVLEMPDFLGGFAPLAAFLHDVLPASHAPATVGQATIAGLASLIGIGAAWALWGRGEGAHLSEGLTRLARGGFGFDALYDLVLVRPYTWLARRLAPDPVDGVFTGTAALVELAHFEIARTQSGRLRWYVAALAGGGVLLLGLVLWGAP